MTKYCLKKPVVVDAFQMTIANRLPNDNWPEWLYAIWERDPHEGSLWVEEDGSLVLKACDKTEVEYVEVDDWITMDNDDGYFQIVDPQHFVNIFELVQ